MGRLFSQEAFRAGSWPRPAVWVRGSLQLLLGWALRMPLAINCTALAATGWLWVYYPGRYIVGEIHSVQALWSDSLISWIHVRFDLLFFVLGPKCVLLSRSQGDIKCLSVCEHTVESWVTEVFAQLCFSSTPQRHECPGNSQQEELRTREHICPAVCGHRAHDFMTHDVSMCPVPLLACQPSYTRSILNLPENPLCRPCAGPCTDKLSYVLSYSTRCQVQYLHRVRTHSSVPMTFLT